MERKRLRLPFSPPVALLPELMDRKAKCGRRFKLHLVNN